MVREIKDMTVVVVVVVVMMVGGNKRSLSLSQDVLAPVCFTFLARAAL